MGRARPYPGTCREAAHATLDSERGGWRLNVNALGEDAIVDYRDVWEGPQREDVRTTCGDFGLGRPGLPTYQLAVVYDDRAMGITDVVRGSDLLGSSARQFLLHRALATLDAAAGSNNSAPYSEPRVAHHPLVLAAGGEKLSKRNRSMSLTALREAGASPGEVIATACASVGMVRESVGSMTPEDAVEAFADASAPAGLACPKWRDGTLIRSLLDD